MNEPLEFEAPLKAHKGMDAHFIEFPFDVEKLYGTRGQVKVKATFDGVPYRGSLAKMGHHCHFLLVRKDVRSQIGKSAGETVRVTIERDTEERVVEIPDDLLAAFAAHPAAQAFFDTLSFTNRKEYAVWITSAKRPETRTDRLQKNIQKLLEGRKNPSDK